MAMAARNELIAAESANILRHARVIQIKRAAFGFAPIADKAKFHCETLLSRPKKPRPIFIVPARHTRAFKSCQCLRPRHRVT
jgi:hypothetical protein